MEVQIAFESVVDVKQEVDHDDSIKIKIESGSSSEADAETEGKQQMIGLPFSRHTYKCSFCSNSFSTYSSLNRHKKNVHGKNVPSEHQENSTKSVQFTMRPKVITLAPCLLTIIRPPADDRKKPKEKRKQNMEVRQIQEGESEEAQIRQETFQCALCPTSTSFNSVLKLHRHMLSRHPKKRKRPNSLQGETQCEICFMTLTDLRSLNRHRKIHLGVSEFKCQHCSKHFAIKKSLDLHLVLTHKEKRSNVRTYTCEFCGNIYPNIGALERHVANVHVVDKSVECEVCGRMFVDESQLARHVRDVHRYTRKVFTCDLCFQRFTTKQGIVRHFRVEHGRFSYCYKCSRSFETNEDFDQHSVVVSDSMELQCDICVVFLPSQCSFNIHTNFHEKQIKSNSNDVQVQEQKSAGFKSPHDSILKEKRFKCDLCLKTFSKSLYLVNHRKRVHPGSKWKCGSCGKTFQKRCQLNLHEHVHSKNIPWECKVCKKTFRSQWHLRRHEKSHSGVKRFKCLICPTSFHSTLNLRVHMGNYHGGERPFKCYLCGKSWVTKWSLKSHLLSHSDEKSFVCDKCGKCFKSNTHLRRHHKFIHSAKLPSISRKFLKSEDDSLVFVCSICDFEMKDGKEVALHNMKHGLPKVVAFKAVLCGKHINKSSVLSFEVQNTFLDTSRSIKSKPNCMKMKEEYEACSLCYNGNGDDYLLANSVVTVNRPIQPRFKCLRCFKLFEKKPSLTKHLKCHFNEKGKRCPRCGRLFATHVSITRHLKSCKMQKKISRETFTMSTC